MLLVWGNSLITSFLKQAGEGIRASTKNNCDYSRDFIIYFFKSLITKPTTLNTNEQEAIGGAVADPAACVVSMPPKYQHVVSSLGSEE